MLLHERRRQAVEAKYLVRALKRVIADVYARNINFAYERYFRFIMGDLPITGELYEMYEDSLVRLIESSVKFSERKQTVALVLKHAYGIPVPYYDLVTVLSKIVDRYNWFIVIDTSNKTKKIIQMLFQPILTPPCS